MAPLPTIPTSFVPHKSSAGPRQFRMDFSGAYSFFAYIVLFVSFVLAIGVFFYGRYLDSAQASKEAELAKAEAAIDQATVEGFVHLRDRLDSSKSLLAGHVAFSNIFSAIETLLPATVRFTSLHISIDPSGAARAEGAGAAKSFNALAAASNIFATDSRIKDVIFSKISVNPTDNTVSFAFSAGLDPKVINFAPNGPSATAPSTPGTTATTTKP